MTLWCLLIASLRLFVSLPCLFLILGDILLLKLPHSLNLIQINDEAFIIWVHLLDTLSAEHGQMIGTVKMFDSLLVIIANLLLKSIFVVLVQVKVGLRQDRILFYNFIQNVDIQWQPLCTFQLFDQLSADGASDSVLMMQLLDAISAQSMAAMNKYSGDPFSNIILESTKLADVKSSRLIVQVHYVHFQHSNWIIIN